MLLRTSLDEYRGFNRLHAGRPRGIRTLHDEQPGKTHEKVTRFKHYCLDLHDYKEKTLFH